MFFVQLIIATFFLMFLQKLNRIQCVLSIIQFSEADLLSLYVLLLVNELINSCIFVQLHLLICNPSGDDSKTMQ